ncbi:hypothetical protein [Klebsiella michiganensis]|uniref:hypothetical protein n=2 Tax=Enterobacteriaceae TaxID=543 RepID=UPI000B5A8FF9|nr:hypothetical protein [Klebsiella michiganensis]OWY84578.1 hypothetical protein CAC00_28500 [Raoultella ornithinolytica]
MVNMKMLTETKKVILCSEGLSKLGHILSMLCQAVKDNNCDPDDIEGCLCIAWDIVNSMQQTIKNGNKEVAE